MHFFSFQAHVEARLAFATLHANDNWYNKVDVDEKWYFAWKAGGKLKVPPNEEAPRKFLKSKRHVPKVMFLAATARPWAIPQYGTPGDPDFVLAQMFDGKIGIWRVSEPKIALKRSIYHEKDDVYEKDVTLNGDRYAAMIVEKVMPAIRKKMPWLVHECRAGHFNSGDRDPTRWGNTSHRQREARGNDSSMPTPLSADPHRDAASAVSGL